MTAAAEGPPARRRSPISLEQSLGVWRADHWTCRYCSELVFFPPAMRAVARRFGNHGYFHPNWTTDAAPLLIKRGASVDHVIPVTLDGEHHMANFVTACWECNLNKSNETGWEPRPVPSGGTWDGMLALFKGLAAQEPDGTERRWLKAIRVLGM